ncbi:MAG TPA: biopolymer transporter ExbD [Polyangiaceae bacterium]
MSLSAAQRGKIRRLSQPRELSPDEEGGELNIVPFLDIVVNILIFVLATVAVTFTATIVTNPPANKGPGVRAEIPTQALNLSVFIVSDGFSLKASGGNIAPGCNDAGAGIAVPKQSGNYDFAGLTACASRLKGSSADFADETQATITANPGVEFQTVVAVMDALRTTPTGDNLFENIQFGVPR